MKTFFFCLNCFFLLSLFKAPVWADDPFVQKVVKDIDYLYMYSGLPMSYRLPEKFRKERLIFSGNYKRYTGAVYRKEQNDILFNPIRSGSAVMVIKNSKNQILIRISLSIQRDNLHKIAAELRDLLVTVDGIEIKIYNNKVIIDGQVMLPAEMDRIAKVVADYSPKVRSFVSYSPRAQKRIAELIESEIEYPEVEVKYAYNRFLLQGCVNSAEEKNRAISIANLYTQFEVNPVGKGVQKRGIPILKDNLKVPCESVKKNQEEDQKKNSIAKLIQVVVHFVQMSKSFNKGFLFQWSPAIGDQGSAVTGSIGNNPGLTSGITATLTATVANFFPKLNWAKRFNFARVLHNSSLLMENQVEGTISTTTQVPDTRTSDGNTSVGGTVAQVNVGVTPTIIGPSENMIQLVIQITVSSPEDGGTTSRTISTRINVRDGSSAVIGGLTSSFLSQKYNDAPSGIQNGIPILNLHSSKAYDTKKNQFVVFVTPLIKSSASIGVNRIKEKFRIND